MRKTTAKGSRWRSATEKTPALLRGERAALLRSLEEAEARVKAGNAVVYDADTFRDRLVNIYRTAQR